MIGQSPGPRPGSPKSPRNMIRSIVAGKRFQPTGTVVPSDSVSGRTEIVTGALGPACRDAPADQSAQRSPHHDLAAQVDPLALDLSLEQVRGAQQPSHEDVGRPVVELVRRADLDDPAQVHHGQVVRQGERSTGSSSRPGS